MAHTETHAGVSTPKTQLFGSRPNSVAIIVAALKAWRRSAARRKALTNLTPDQLKDIGHSAINRPALEIRAGLMTKLMSMQ